MFGIEKKKYLCGVNLVLTKNGKNGRVDKHKPF